jgi:tetratricopeptide (TPR) repeat protein
MAFEKHFIEYIGMRQQELEEALRSIDALDSCSALKPECGPVSSTYECYYQLGIIYWYWGYYRKGARMFRYCLELDRPFYHAVNSPEDTCKGMIEKSILLKLAGVKDDQQAALAEEVLRVCASAESWRSRYIKEGNYDRAGFMDLWKGYAQLLLKRYDDAVTSLDSTVSLYEKYRKRRGIWQKEEAFLPKVLIPVARCGLLPDETRRKEAWEGMEEFITLMRDDLRDPDDTRRDISKLTGYLYYFHLKESFPRIFSRDAIPAEPRP